VRELCGERECFVIEWTELISGEIFLMVSKMIGGIEFWRLI
jgi:hypothetical protein